MLALLAVAVVMAATSYALSALDDGVAFFFGLGVVAEGQFDPDGSLTATRKR